MAKTNGAVFNFDHIAAMVNWISDICDFEYGIGLTKEAKVEIVEHVLLHYHDHIMAYSVSVSGSDPYKFLAWAGIFIYENLKTTDREVAIKFLASSIAAMNRSLLLCGKNLPDWYLRKLLRMVINEFDNNHHIGLGRNGLYMAFKGASLP